MTSSAPCFEDDAREVLGTVRGAYAALLGELGAISRPVDVEQALGLDKKLAWRVHRVATAQDPLEGAPFVPSRTSVNRLARSASRSGVDATTVNGVLDATAAFERLIATHASDRPAFDAMAAGISGQGHEQLQLEARRAAMRANVVVHGKVSELLMYSFIARPGEADDTVDAVSLRGHVGLQRLRRDAAIEIARHRFESEGEAIGGAVPLDAEAAARCGAPVVGELAADALVERTTPDGFTRTLLANPDLGLGAALDCVLGEITHAWPLTGEALGSMCEVATPTRRLVHDMVLRDDLAVAPPDACVVHRAASRDHWPEPDSPDRLPVPAIVAALGRGARVTQIAEWSGYTPLVVRAIEALGDDPERYRTWRVVVDHPPLHALVWLRAIRR